MNPGKEVRRARNERLEIRDGKNVVLILNNERSKSIDPGVEEKKGRCPGGDIEKQ